MLAEGTTIGEITTASKKTGDLSRQALATIYGDVVNNPLASSETGGVDTILASIFQVLNGALLVVGSLWACYIIFRKLTRTAHDGDVFDKQNTTVWGPVRIVWGLVSLVPTANGWSLSQLLMLWSASTMGIGIANLSTDAAISAFEDGKGMVVQPAMPSTLQLGHNLFEANICMHGINAGLAEAAAQGGLVTQGGYVQQVPTSSGFVLKNKSFICGGADINADLEAQSSSSNWFSTTIDTSQIRKAHLDALVAMQNTITNSALSFVNEVVQKKNGAGDISDVEGVIQSAAQAYEITVNQSVGTKQGDIEALSNQMSTSIKEAGWWSLGRRCK
ncbi:Integral membrane protein, partial [Pseudomonas savastanoi]